MNEIHSPVLVWTRGRCDKAALQTDAFAPFHLHPKLQAFQPILPVNPFLANLPALALEHDEHAQITKSWTVHGDLPNAQAQGTLIACLAFFDTTPTAAAATATATAGMIAAR